MMAILPSVFRVTDCSAEVMVTLSVEVDRVQGRESAELHVQGTRRCMSLRSCQSIVSHQLKDSRPYGHLGEADPPSSILF